MEAAALRRRLTSIAENPAGASDLLSKIDNYFSNFVFNTLFALVDGLPSMINETMNSIPSPIRVESPNNTNPLPPAPMMMPPFLPQGFLPGAPPPFLPPPPFMPGQDMMGMGPPLGRLMSPPPKRFTPTMRDDRNRYSPRGRSGRYSPDSRYDDYTAFETETDYSPPPSPSPPPRRGFNSQSDRSKKSKGNGSNRYSSSSSSTCDEEYDDW
jgi:transport and golgi organization protein 1